MLNRLANLFLEMLFNIRLNDTTNAFKTYRKTVIDGCRPLIAPHFNLTVELPLKATFADTRGARFPSLGGTVGLEKPSWRSERWVADMSLSVFTYGWRNISAGATTGNPAAIINSFEYSPTG